MFKVKVLLGFTVYRRYTVYNHISRLHIRNSEKKNNKRLNWSKYNFLYDLLMYFTPIYLL